MNYEELKSLLTKANESNKNNKFQEAETLAGELLEKLEKISESTDTVIARQGDELHYEALKEFGIGIPST